MSKRLNRMATSCSLALVALLGCAGGETTPPGDSAAATAPADGGDPAAAADALPLVIEPVSGSFDEAPQPNRVSEDELSSLRAAAAVN